LAFVVTNSARRSEYVIMLNVTKPKKDFDKNCGFSQRISRK